MKVVVMEKGTFEEAETFATKITITIGEEVYEISPARQREGINIHSMNKIIINPLAANSVDIGSGDW